MDEFILLTTTEGLEPGSMKTVFLEDHEMLVARVENEYFVTDARCPHLGGRLAEGTLEGSVVTCPRHHSEFDLSDGRVVRWTDWEGVVLGVGKLLRHPRPLRTYAIKVEAGNIMVGPEKAPPPVGS